MGPIVLRALGPHGSISMNYAAILSPSSIAGKNSNARRVQEFLQTGNVLTHKQIAETVGCHKVYVAQVKEARLLRNNHLGMKSTYLKRMHLTHRISQLHTRAIFPPMPLRKISREECVEHNMSIRDKVCELEAKSRKY